MAQNIRLSALVLLVGTSLIGCHAGGSSMVPGVSSQNPGTASFSVVVPAVQKAVVGAPAPALSIVVALTQTNGANPATKIAPVTMNLGSKSSGCVSSSGSMLTCTVKVAVPAGSDTFSVSSYSQADGGGQLISVEQKTTSISPGGKTACVKSKSSSTIKPASNAQKT